MENPIKEIPNEKEIESLELQDEADEISPEEAEEIKEAMKDIGEELEEDAQSKIGVLMDKEIVDVQTEAIGDKEKPIL